MTRLVSEPPVLADGGGVASVLGPVLRAACGGELPVRLRAWDGSETGPSGPPVLVLRDRAALRRLLWRPGELGLAQAYVTGELDVEGDLDDGLRAAWQIIRDRGLGRRGLPSGSWLALARAAVTLQVLGPRPAAPASQVRVRGRLHSISRDRAVVAGHYDLPPQFWELILDPSMAYSCGCWRSRAPGYDLADSQRDKLEQISRKLALRPGSRLLDLGCGWGSLSVHAAGQYDADVTAVTLSGQQARYVRRRAAAAGLADRVHVRAVDYRAVGPGCYDAIACIEMGEHVGAGQYPVFCAQLAALLRPGGRLLVQQMARGSRSPGGGRFIEAFITPDMHMRPVGQTVGLLEDAGFEVLQVHAMRDDYARTIRAWRARLERHYPQVEAIIGEEAARAWRLYLAGGALAFEEGRMSVHQILAARPADSTGPRGKAET